MTMITYFCVIMYNMAVNENPPLVELQRRISISSMTVSDDVSFCLLSDVSVHLFIHETFAAMGATEQYESNT